MPIGALTLDYGRRAARRQLERLANPSDGLDGLICLSLYGNELTTLPVGVFDGLTNLQELDLRKNHLVGLTRDDPLFAEMGSLKHLRL